LVNLDADDIPAAAIGLIEALILRQERDDQAYRDRMGSPRSQVAQRCWDCTVVRRAVVSRNPPSLPTGKREDFLPSIRQSLKRQLRRPSLRPHRLPAPSPTIPLDSPPARSKSVAPLPPVTPTPKSPPGFTSASPPSTPTSAASTPNSASPPAAPRRDSRRTTGWCELIRRKENDGASASLREFCHSYEG
jgi:hypothetical protein